LGSFFTKKMKKIGVLLPQSKSFPKMGKEFLNGLRMTLSKEANFEIKIEGIGLANNPEDVMNSIQKLINQEEVSLTTGILGHQGLNEIHNFMDGIDEPLIYADFGSIAPADLSDRKNIWCNSLNLCQSTGMLAKYFGDNSIKNVAISTSYYDSGYGFVQAMENEFQSTQQSQFSGHFITPLHPRENEASLMQEFISTHPSDAVFAFHNGVYAKEHASYLKENKINKNIPLYTLPFSVDERVLEEYPEVFNETRCITSWFAELDTPENKIFVTDYKNRYGSLPSVFAVLGYENGILIKNYFEDQALSSQTLIGPRGSVSVSADLKRTEYSFYLVQLIYQNDRYEQQVIEKFEIEKNSKSISSTVEVGGWHNAYLCH